MTALELVVRNDALHGQEAGVNRAALDVCYETLCNVLEESATEVERNTSDLSVNFKALAEATGAQANILGKLVDTASRLEHDNGYMSFEDFMKVMNDSISSTIGQIVTIAENAMALSFVMEGVIEQLNGITRFLGQVNKINNQTRMLALNATIEAARAGDAGHGFAVVAREVKHVSAQIDTMAKEMQDQIGNITAKVQGGQETLEKVAGIDMSANVRAKEEIENLLAALLKQSRAITSVVQESSDSVKAISSKISGITVSMQFQDRNSQTITNLISLTRKLREYENDPLKHPLPNDPVAALDVLASVLTLSAIRQKIFARAAQSGMEGAEAAGGRVTQEDVELF